MTPTELHTARVALGLTQHHAAKALGVSRSTYCTWEAGTARIPGMMPLAIETLGLIRRERLGGPPVESAFFSDGWRLRPLA